MTKARPVEVDSVQMAHAQEALQKLRSLSEVTRDRAIIPNFLQLIGHVELRSLLWLFDLSAENANAFIAAHKTFAIAIDDVKRLVVSGSKRGEIIGRLDQCLKDVGLTK